MDFSPPIQDEKDEKSPVQPVSRPGEESSASSIDNATILSAPLPNFTNQDEEKNTSSKSEPEQQQQPQQNDTSPLSPSSPPADVPDGGLDAWLQVLGSFVMLFNSWGLVNTFGVYQTWYEKHFANVSSSDISWIGSIQGSLLMISGLISGPLYDAGYFRHLLWSGCALVVLGQFMTSLADRYWEALLAQGVCIGLGGGLGFLPATGVLSQYFRRRRSIAIGIASAGSPIGGMVFPVIFTKVEEKLGFGWGTRVIGFVLLGSSAIPLATMHTRLPVAKTSTATAGSKRRRRKMSRRMVEKEALRDWPFMAYLCGSFLIFLGLYVAVFYVQLFGDTRILGDGGGFDSAYIVTLLNAGSILGRLLPNYLADHFGAMNAFGLTGLGVTACAAGWAGITSLGGLCAFAVLYGMFSGGIVSLMPSVIVNLSPDLGRVGVRMGMVCAASGVAILVGTPVAGAIVGGYSDGEWDATIGYAAGTLAAGTFFCVASRLLVFRTSHYHRGWCF